MCLYNRDYQIDQVGLGNTRKSSICDRDDGMEEFDSWDVIEVSVSYLWKNTRNTSTNKLFVLRLFVTWGIIESVVLRSSSPRGEIGIPSIIISPPLISDSRNNAEMRELFPAPVRPTIPTYRDKARKTSRFRTRLNKAMERVARGKGHCVFQQGRSILRLPLSSHDKLYRKEIIVTCVPTLNPLPSPGLWHWPWFSSKHSALLYSKQTTLDQRSRPHILANQKEASSQGLQQELLVEWSNIVGLFLPRSSESRTFSTTPHLLNANTGLDSTLVAPYQMQ